MIVPYNLDSSTFLPRGTTSDNQDQLWLGTLYVALHQADLPLTSSREIPHCITSFSSRQAAKMAASAVEGSEVVTTLSVSLGISKEVIAQIASLNEDAATVLRRVKDVFDERSSSDEKYRTDMANLRRARVNAGLSFACSVPLKAVSVIYFHWKVLHRTSLKKW